jgi:flagellar basal body-associated protein FliL
MNLLGIVLYSFTGVLLLGLAVAIWWLVDTVSLSSTQAKRSTSKNNRQKLPISQNQLFYLERELLTLVNGDKALATRLLLNIRLRNPQRSKSWCYEKVIYDLKRDRGGI